MVAILYNIRSLHNVGSIFRTADAAGVEKLYLCGITPAPIDRFGKIRPQIAKVALGSEKTLAWKQCGGSSSSPTIKLVNRLKKEGYTVWAVEQAKNSIPYYKAVLRRDQDQNKLAFIFGNEVRGLPPAILSRAERILEIPMRGKKESLNVAVAFGIIIFRLIYKNKV